MLARMVEREWAEGFDLSGSVTIEVGTASYRTTRGYTIVAALCDEMAFWPTDDSAQPDYEWLNALRPGDGYDPGASGSCAPRPPTQGAARCGMRGAATTGAMGTRSSYGRRPRAR